MDSGRKSAVSDDQPRLRERVRRTELRFAASFLPLGDTGFSAGGLDDALAFADSFIGRAKGDPPGYQTV